MLFQVVLASASPHRQKPQRHATIRSAAPGASVPKARASTFLFFLRKA